MHERGSLPSHRRWNCCARLTISLALLGAWQASVTADTHRVPPGPLTVTAVSRATGETLPGVLLRLGTRYGATQSDGTFTFDGVPSGDHRLIVVQPGFARYETSLTLPADSRPPVHLELTPVEPVAIHGRAQLADTGQKAPGARVVLTPADVPAALQGVFEFTADWAGEFAVLTIPAGRYDADVSLAGCAPLHESVEIGPGQEELVFELVREEGPAALMVNVQNAATGAPLAHAHVVLAEAWPHGVVGDAVTDENGVARFDGLRIGRLNWVDQNDRLQVSRHELTLHVECADFAPQTDLVVVRGETETMVALTPTVAVAEIEPNNDTVSAQDVLPGAPLQLMIDPKGDRDIFRFRLAHAAFVTLELGPECPIETSLLLTDDAAKDVAHAIGYVGKPAVIQLGLPPGTYCVDTGARYNSATTAAPLTLRITADVAADPFEPNEEAARARLLLPGQELRGTILPLRDQDYYHFDMPRPGVARFTMPPHPLERALSVLDQTGEQCGQIIGYANAPVDFQVSLAAGSHTLLISHRYLSQESTEPYAIRFDTCQDDRIDDPAEQPNRIAAVRTLPLPGVLGGTIDPLKDVDCWTIPTPSAGLLRTLVTPPDELSVRVRAADGHVLAQTIAYPNRTNELVWSAPAATLAYLELRHRYDSRWSATPYTLETRWEPADEYEFLARNDDLARATPVWPGETLRGSVTPIADNDYYRLDLPHPAYLEVAGQTPIECEVTIYDAAGRPGGRTIFYPDADMVIGADLPAGACYVAVKHRYNSASSVRAYALATVLHWADPQERWPLAHDAIRLLKLGTAEAFGIDQLKDVDRFAFVVDAAGPFRVTLFSPIELFVRLLDDRTGAEVRNWVVYGNQVSPVELESKGSTRYRLEVQQRYDSQRSPAPCYVLVDDQARELVAKSLSTSVNAGDPTEVTITRGRHTILPPAARVLIDADGDGQVDLTLDGAPSGRFRYPREGLYVAWTEAQGANGTVTRAPLWIAAYGPRERRGVALMLVYPHDGETIAENRPCTGSAVSYEQGRIMRVAAAVDGQRVADTYGSPFELAVPWRSLGGGAHELVVTAWDAHGHAATTTRTITVSEYFDFQPPDGATLSGDEVVVSWTAPAFGPAKVQYRPQGADTWQEAVGEQGRRRRITLTGLEPGQVYEIQPLGGSEPGPLRTLTRVKGLAFGQARYGATIKRDYDQRLPISVRNHAEQPLTVRLECGQPLDSRLLIGFVGEGSVDAPFELRPGEEREFVLALSAQEVIKPDHAFPIRITSADGLTDEAEVAIHVRLPVVDLAWEDAGPTPLTLGRILRLHNRGDTLTDLRLSSSNPDVTIAPAIEHGLFAAGDTLEMRALPRLHEGFTSADTELVAGALDTSVTFPLQLSLGEGQAIYGVQLIAGRPASQNPSAATSDAEATARALAGAFLNPDSVDWSQRRLPEDADGDGRVDRWTIDDEFEGVRWIGEDTDEDGEIDFVHGDVGMDGQFEYSAFRTEAGWDETNIVEAWLEMVFSLPWTRNQYHPHDVAVAVNGVTISELHDALPEGNYTFRVPPTALRFDDTGNPADNGVEIRSEHLRGGHYVVNSDFCLKLRLTNTRVWVVADSDAAARIAAVGVEGLTLDGPDFSVSATDLSVTGELKAGSQAQVHALVRNIGASAATVVVVALELGVPGRRGVELCRQELTDVALSQSVPITLPWTVSAGMHTLYVVVDPDQQTTDAQRANNRAQITVKVAGDDAPPTLVMRQPKAAAAFDLPVVALEIDAADESGLCQVEARLDDGVWQTLAGEDATRLAHVLAQPGAHTVTVRVTDSGGNRVEQAQQFTVNATGPAATLDAPADGATVDARQTPVRVNVGGEVALVGARINGGPWQRLNVADGVAQGDVALSFGDCTLNVLVMDPRGVVTILSRKLRCTQQPTEEEPDEPAAIGGQPGVVQLPEIGVIDAFTATNQIVGQPPGLLAPDEVPDVLRDQTLRFAGTVNGLKMTAVFSGNGVALDCATPAGHGRRTTSGPLRWNDADHRRISGRAPYVCHYDGGRAGVAEFIFNADGTAADVLWTPYGRPVQLTRWLAMSEDGEAAGAAAVTEETP